MDEQVKSILETVRGEPSNILKALLALQEQLGYVPAEAVSEIAHALGVTTAQVAGRHRGRRRNARRPPGRDD